MYRCLYIDDSSNIYHNSWLKKHTMQAAGAIGFTLVKTTIINCVSIEHCIVPIVRAVSPEETHITVSCRLLGILLKCVQGNMDP